MKKTAIILFVIISLFIFASCHKIIDESDTLPYSDVQTGAFQVPSNTKIFNGFASQLPGFAFKNPIIESYDESFSYEFTVLSNSGEFKSYVEALKAKGFVSGTEGYPVSGDGYYKATNSDRFMVEAVLKDGANLTVTVTRP